MLPLDEKRALSASAEVDVPQGEQLRLHGQDDRESIGNRTISAAIPTATTLPFNTTGVSGRARVTNVAGHIFHGDVNMHMYNGASAVMSSSLPPPQHLATSDFLIEPPPSQPLAPDIWFGRDGTVSNLAGIIAGNENPRIAIMGGGGIGKTATTLHLIWHEAVRTRYGDRIFFVACDAITSTQLLVSSILKIIGVTAGPGENLVTVMHRALKSAPPTLIVLDNFESTWDAEKDHTATRDLLQKIADSPSSALIVTMRATTPPPGIRWTFFESLPPLAASAAKEVFLAINPTFCDGWDDGNEVLVELLRELDHVPLAIHLLAHVATDMSPQHALKQWRKKRTDMLSLDRYTNDKLESVDVSISWSMDSLNVTRNPGAIQLLGMLCLLPDGLLRSEDRLETIDKSFDTTTSDLFLLRTRALVYTSGYKLGVLSPIRYFVLQHHPPDFQHAQCICNIFWELVNTYAPVDFSPELHGAIEALSPEIGNIGNLIDHAVAHDPGEIIVDITIQMTWHLWRADPSSHLLKKVAPLIPSVKAEMQARYWHIAGEILYKRDEWAEAASASNQARGLFLEIGDGLSAAHCSRRLGDILRMQGNYFEAMPILMDARAQFIEIGNRLGATQCSHSLAYIHRIQGHYSEANAMFRDALAQFAEIGYHMGVAQCSKSLGITLISQGNYAEATTILTDTREQFIEIGDLLGAAQCSLCSGNFLRRQGKNSDATIILKDARAQFIKIRDRLGAAQCSQTLGMILIEQGNYSEATTILTDARAQFTEIGFRMGEADCSVYLGTILLRQRDYIEAESLLTHARDVFTEIGMVKSKAAHYSKLLEECARARDDEKIMETSI